ncbi:hypothetical protein FGG08_000529 [Glutinoglossum americanum]|uniref:Uncharacterized protein n=1 Tax=Glutinoglossum americanum TaxID=1670608 RepID=A0A9P8ID75_9PEZI|nr:hypothetical protein FGG08_000529 [Glutinoglossum americanum]
MAVQHRHRDAMQRPWQGLYDDRYPSPFDGRLSELLVQCTDDIYEGERNSTWRRTFVRNINPMFIRFANFPFSNGSTEPAERSGSDWGVILAKWIPACCALLFVLPFSAVGAEGHLKNGGWYDPFPYRYWGYPKITRNPYEGTGSTRIPNRISERVLGPRYLNFLTASSGFVPAEVNEMTASTPYVFIGYTQKQFDNESDEDMTNLHLIAETAARAAGVPAFWVAGSCMPDRDELAQDVYRISDDDMLRVWGQRMWTLSEALLSPHEHLIKVYTHGQAGDPWEISKKHFAAVAWDDPLISRQLVDHYINNLDLSRLELVAGIGTDNTGGGASGTETGDDETVILDGAFGAAIRWKSFALVRSARRGTWKRTIGRLLLHGSPFLVLMVRVTYNGKLWNTQAWFFGFEGHLDLATIESRIFGAYLGRLKWSPSGSPISQHVRNGFGECVGIDPIVNDEVRSKVAAASRGRYGDLKVFTLVDTYTMTVTMFEAVRPPVAVLLCGSEGDAVSGDSTENGDDSAAENVSRTSISVWLLAASAKSPERSLI